MPSSSRRSRGSAPSLLARLEQGLHLAHELRVFVIEIPGLAGVGFQIVELTWCRRSGVGQGVGSQVGPLVIVSAGSPVIQILPRNRMLGLRAARPDSPRPSTGAATTAAANRLTTTTAALMAKSWFQYQSLGKRLARTGGRCGRCNPVPALIRGSRKNSFLNRRDHLDSAPST